MIEQMKHPKRPCFVNVDSADHDMSTWLHIHRTHLGECSTLGMMQMSQKCRHMQLCNINIGNFRSEYSFGLCMLHDQLRCKSQLVRCKFWDTLSYTHQVGRCLAALVEVLTSVLYIVELWCHKVSFQMNCRGKCFEHSWYREDIIQDTSRISGKSWDR